ncbi:MAG: acyl carrier protein [Bauldia sp.]|nr:acyl carrier protein [Bauldia sp.]
MTEVYTPTADASQIRKWMIDYISSVIDVPKDDFPVDARFDEYGLDSVEAVIMCGLMEEAFVIRVEPTEFFENPTVNTFASHLASRIAGEA